MICLINTQMIDAEINLNASRMSQKLDFLPYLTRSKEYLNDSINHSYEKKVKFNFAILKAPQKCPREIYIFLKTHMFYMSIHNV